MDLTADQVKRDSEGVVSATGNVEVIRGEETLKTEELQYDPGRKQLRVKGHVVITSPRGEIHAESGELNTVDNTGSLRKAEMIFPDGEHLHADELQRLDLTTFHARDMVFSACPHSDEAWSLAAEEVTLDQNEGELRARNAFFYIKGVPVLYTPYWKEPLKRKSGFLTPTFASGKRRGTELSLPYYFAPTPSLDITLTPHWMSARGIRPELEFRHVSRYGNEFLQGEWLNDAVLGRSRGRLKARTQWETPASTHLSIEADHVSDRDYLADFSSDYNETSQRYLQSRATLAWEKEVNSWSLWVRHQQDLTRTSNQATLRVLPRFENQFVFPFFDQRLLVHFDQQTTRFERKLGEDGWRINLHPYFEIPWESPGGGISVKLHSGVQHTRYWLRDAPPGRDSNLSSAEFGLETMAVIERIFANGTLRHSIEPTLRYDLVGVGDQSLLPNFDSAFGKLTLENLMSNNRFSGTDRIESAHRITLLLANRLESRNRDTHENQTIMLLKTGISYNLRRKRVDPAIQLTPRPFSNLIADAMFKPLPSLGLYARGQYDPGGRFFATAQAGAEWISSFGHELHLAYRLTDARYVSPEEQSANVLAKVRIASRWRILGSWYYNMISRTTQLAGIGVEYRHPCWQIQLEGYRLDRTSSTTAQADLGVRVMLRFKGLGSVGP